MIQINHLNFDFKEMFFSWGYICLCALVLIVLIALIIILVLKKKNKKKNIPNDNYYLKLFGGKENIISCSSKGSRLVLELKDYSLIDENELKKIGINSLIKATNKITLLVGDKAKDFATHINEGLKG
jgi:phosphotransferase system IIB component